MRHVSVVELSEWSTSLWRGGRPRPPGRAIARLNAAQADESVRRSIRDDHSVIRFSPVVVEKESVSGSDEVLIGYFRKVDIPRDPQKACENFVLLLIRKTREVFDDVLCDARHDAIIGIRRENGKFR